MTIKYFKELIQGSDEWLQARIGLLTASEMKHIITPGKLQYAVNDKSRAHVNEIAAQRITNYCEPSYIGDDMLRGQFDEVEAKNMYNKKYAKTSDCGFIVNDKFGFTIGYSPDALVGDDGLIECKSRKQKYQVETIVADEVPAEYMLQLQTGLMVTERKWIDFISYSGGLPMFVKRVFPDITIQSAIISAAMAFEAQVQLVINKYNINAKQFHMTERKTFDDEITASFDQPSPSNAGVGWDKDAPGSKEAFFFGSCTPK